MTHTKVGTIKGKEKRGLLLIIVTLLYLFYTLFFWIFMLGSQASFSFIGFTPPIWDNVPSFYVYIINFFLLYIPFFTVIAILNLKKIGVYILILSFLSFIQIEIWE